ncbi:hypothetical protein M8997_007335 [Phyllobacterium sp. 21LDTY02-6]|uniref:S10 family serine carboxypeptidase-like protein n=1 Tax=Phyllobacterium sp. 21LDTY02-6 TaxID=2944903 RepID=UPI00201FED7B|nr:hypothetical protein [Phyllobacterium sp. 21LDTY02-6]MCO4316991.1 hypothetical protein [Phyllobacterium sp. 21LDTY02-6]
MRLRSFSFALALILSACDGGSDSDISPPKSVSAVSAFPAFPVAAPPVSNDELPDAAETSDRPYDAYDSVDYAQVSQTPSSRRHTATINGATIAYTATAGHLVAYDLTKMKIRPNSAPPEGAAEAAIFYTAYTSDDARDKDLRPVTFVFNGGPGASSAALDFGALGPKDAGNGSYQDNPASLLDRTDLVFVDPVGTGYSAAILPHMNRDFWGVDSDAKVLRDFIISYINANNRQSSPKYIYGVSYGGMRAPIMARLLLEEGSRNYAADPGGKPANILSGLILNSPYLNGNSDCDAHAVSCAGNFPTYLLIARHHKKAERLVISLATAEQEMFEFSDRFTTLYWRVFDTVYDDEARPGYDRTRWDAYLKTAAAKSFIDTLHAMTGIGKSYEPGAGPADNPWVRAPNMSAQRFRVLFAPEKGVLSINDGRKFIEPSRHDPAFVAGDIYYDAIKPYQEAMTGYRTKAHYLDQNARGPVIWDYKPDSRLALGADRTATCLVDLAYALRLNARLKVLVQHGYFDLNTPYHRTRQDLADADLATLVSLSLYPAGHALVAMPAEAFGRSMVELRGFYDDRSAGVVAASRPAGSVN